MSFDQQAFDNAANDKYMNNLFKGCSFIIGFPATGQVVGYFIEEPMMLRRRLCYTGAMIELPAIKPAILASGGLSVVSMHNQMRHQLRKRYPNCRIRLVEPGYAPRYPGHRIIAKAMLFLENLTLFPAALKPLNPRNAQ